jgi:hypothetical protein
MQEKINSFIKIDRTSCTMREKEKEEKEKKGPVLPPSQSTSSHFFFVGPIETSGPSVFRWSTSKDSPFAVLESGLGLGASFSLALYIFWFLITTIS